MKKENYILRSLLIFLTGFSIINTLNNDIDYRKLKGTAKKSSYNYVNIKNKAIQKVNSDVAIELQTYNKNYRGIQDIAMDDKYIYMSYHDVFEVKNSENKDHLKTYVVRCKKNNCNNTKQYQIFTGTGRARQFDKYIYNNKNYMILSSNGFNKITNKKTYRTASMDYFNLTTNSSDWETFDKAYNTNDKKYNLYEKSSFKVPKENIDSEISVDIENERMALKVGKNISIYSINPSKINLKTKKYSFELSGKGNKIPTYKNEDGKIINYTTEDILLVGDYLYVAYTTNNKNSDKASYILTYDIKTGKVISDNTYTIQNTSLKQIKLEALTYYNGNIYFSISYVDNNITKNIIYKIISNDYKFDGYKTNSTTVYTKETKSINLKVLDINNKKISVKKWSSSNNKIASVKNGKVTINNPGKVTITATINNNQKLKFSLTVRKKIIAIIGASQVTKMQDNYTAKEKYGIYGIATAQYFKGKWTTKISSSSAQNNGLYFINSGGTGLTFQNGKGWKKMLQILKLNNVDKKTSQLEFSKYIDLYIYFPIAGNNAAKVSCDNIDDNNISNIYPKEKDNTGKIKYDTFENYLGAYNILIQDLKKNYNYNVKTYITALHPYDPLRTFKVNGEVKSDTNKDSTINKKYISTIIDQRNNEIVKRNSDNYIITSINNLVDCQKDTRSNLKYYKFNKQIKKYIANYPDLEYISLFETYFEQTTEEFLARNPFPNNYKTYDNTHWDKNTTIDYVNKLLDKNTQLKSKVSQ